MPEPGVRVIVHAGFHKTGTSSLQDFLSRNRAALVPWLAYYGKMDFLDAGAAARRYGQRPFPWRLWAFRRALRRFLAQIPDAPVIVLSRETFAGVMPGHRDWRGRTVQSYTAAVPLARAIVAELTRRFGPDVQVQFLFTVRDRESWIRSVYGHLLRSIHLTDDFPAFRAGFSDLVDPGEKATHIGRALAPVPVMVAALEDLSARPAGPATAVLDLAGVPEAARHTLQPAHRSNVGQSPALEAEFLRMNRAGGRKGQLKARKDAMLRAAVTDKGR